MRQRQCGTPRWTLLIEPISSLYQTRRLKMNADTYKDFMKALELYHDRKFSKAARDAYWADLQDYSDTRIVLALQASYEKFPPRRVPSINDIKTLLGDIREAAQEKEKKAELANRWPISRRPRSKHPMARESFGILSKLFYQEGSSEKLTARQCIAEMVMMEDKYPGVGWRQGAEELRVWLDKKEERERNAVDKELKMIELRARAELEKESKI